MDMLGSLRNEVLRLARHLQHLSRAGIDLARHKERDELFGHLPEIHIPSHQIIFVAAVGISQRVRVVLEDVNFP